MARKDITKLSSGELFELARQREMEELAREKEALRAQLAELRAERKKILSRHKRELTKMDAQILAAGGRTRGDGRIGTKTGISNTVIALLAGVKQADTKTIREQLEAQGISAANLGQTLAYLKRSGRVKSVARGVYASA